VAARYQARLPRSCTDKEPNLSGLQIKSLLDPRLELFSSNIFIVSGSSNDFWHTQCHALPYHAQNGLFAEVIVNHMEREAGKPLSRTGRVWTGVVHRACRQLTNPASCVTSKYTASPVNTSSAIW
jgi:hypothetical protein